jgi:TonB family protein
MVNAYFASLRMAVKQRYVVPSVIQVHECAKLEATVGVRMDASGEVQDVDIMKRSGNELFDAAVVQAVKAASPLPPPPPNMRELVTKGFGFKFRCSD